MYDPLQMVTYHLPDPEEELARLTKPIDDLLSGDIPTPSELPRRIDDILMSPRQKSLHDAILADLFDVIPGVGDVSNAVRVGRAALEDDALASERLAMQSVDLALGTIPSFVPGAGEVVSTILDFLTPTNMLVYIRENYPPIKKPSFKLELPELPSLDDLLTEAFG